MWLGKQVAAAVSAGDKQQPAPIGAQGFYAYNDTYGFKYLTQIWLPECAHQYDPAWCCAVVLLDAAAHLPQHVLLQRFELIFLGDCRSTEFDYAMAGNRSRSRGCSRC